MRDKFAHTHGRMSFLATQLAALEGSPDRGGMTQFAPCLFTPGA